METKKPTEDVTRQCRFEGIEKRLDDLRSNFNLSLTLFATLLAGGIASLAFMGYLFKADYKDFQTEMKSSADSQFSEMEKQIGLSAGEPNVVVKSSDGQILDGQIVPMTISLDGNKKPHIGYFYQLWNSGDSESGDLLLKFYFKEPLTSEDVQQNVSTDESEFDYEVYYTGDYPKMPPGFSATRYTGFRLDREGAESIEKNSIHDALIKVYYGNGKVSRHAFRIKIEENKVQPGAN